MTELIWFPTLLQEAVSCLSQNATSSGTPVTNTVALGHFSTCVLLGGENIEGSPFPLFVESGEYSISFFLFLLL